MILKIFKAVWFLSLLLVTAALLYGYASLPENVMINRGMEGDMIIGRETFFYVVLALVGVLNVLVFLIAKVAAKSEGFRTWFYGLIITFNVFFVVGVNFIALFNSGEKYDYSRLDNVIYASIALFCLWSVGWPLYWSYQRLFNSTRSA